ncbi:hypothetical protein Ddye_022948 [Dipteronia dyeriana]|uniref:RNase H type-1 domain-containing protein n=1 Tax=Dipteronia dyeriana TaxID=168575 RepID=A0AAD9TSZ7_9ROSI|nr:hypothetical protein Ddye_022948 [Dipteronia dyeriana]
MHRVTARVGPARNLCNKGNQSNHASVHEYCAGRNPCTIYVTEKPGATMLQCTVTARVGTSTTEKPEAAMLLCTVKPNVSHNYTISSLVPCVVTNDENLGLTTVPNDKEIYDTVFSMDSEHTPGPDGFTGQVFWNLNSNLITLIPKVKGAIFLDQDRPIVLSYFIFKVITKIMASRLGRIAACIISPNQFGFIQGWGAPRKHALCAIANKVKAKFSTLKGTMLSMAGRAALLNSVITSSFTIPLWWHTPYISWIKINSDGAARGAVCLAGAGGVFHDHRGIVQGCFAFHIDSAYAFEAELNAVIKAVAYAYVKHWHLLWIESVSIYVCNLLTSRSSKVP